jgi:hypothetical protein
MLAYIAAREAATLGAGLASAVRTTGSSSALDGFAVGLLLAGGVFLALTVQRHGSQTRRRAVPRAPGRARWRLSRALGGYPAGEPARSPSGNDVVVWPAPEAAEPAATPAPSRRGGYRSKHRLSGPEDTRPWPDSRRRAPRHAAQSAARWSGVPARPAARPTRRRPTRGRPIPGRTAAARRLLAVPSALASVRARIAGLLPARVLRTGD